MATPTTALTSLGGAMTPKSIVGISLSIMELE